MSTPESPHSPRVIPVLPLRDITIFPHMIAPLLVGREKSVLALEEVMRKDGQIFLVAQEQAEKDNPGLEDLYRVGCLAGILQFLKLPDGTVKVLVEGVQRGSIVREEPHPEFLQVLVEPLPDTGLDAPGIGKLCHSASAQFEQYVKLNRKIPAEALTALSEIDEPSKLADMIAAHLSLKIADKQELLGTSGVDARLGRIIEFMESEVGMLQVERKIRSRVKRQMEKTQREYYLNEQMKAIQKELGEGENGKDEFSELEERIRKIRLSAEARSKATTELKKLRSMGPMSAEATVIRNYLDWLLGIPWKKESRVRMDVDHAGDILNRDHYGLDKVKERILEHLAVQARIRAIRGPILCLVGPPGVGKTSLGKSIAEATGRRFVRMSVGGIRDEAEIRGHRRTYIGSMPGRIIQSMKKAGTSNPLFLLDEVDKMGTDFRGDPSSALLEVLDPEQNRNFNDHYLEVDYDLSGVMFICTANTLGMPRPLLDRMEVIRLSGYTEDEKVQISRRHLIGKQMSAHGLLEGEWTIDDDALRTLIRSYTRESGVRNLERELAGLTRKAVRILGAGPGRKRRRARKGDATQGDAAAAGVAGPETEAGMAEAGKQEEEKPRHIAITPGTLEEYAGVPKYHRNRLEGENAVGMVNGLAWTEVGGEMLQVEALVMRGRGRMIITGKVGDVMQESARAARSWVRSRCVEFGIRPPVFERREIHVHVPEGATPKDGPSAGVAIVTALVSAMSGIPVRRDVAMTGEITLRGRVLMIGGLKEKLLAALRTGIGTVIIPEDNRKDLPEIPDNVKAELEIIPVSHLSEVLKIALAERPVPIDWTDEDDSDIAPARDEDRDGMIAH